MDSFNISVQRFNEFAQEFANRFMNIDSYKDSIDLFCDLIYKPNPRILELGCGPGNITRYLKHRFPDSKILAIDLAPRMVEIARQEVNDVDFRIMDVRDITAISDKFDLIMCSFCLPFLSKIDTSKLISNCAERLIKNGALYISTMEGDDTNAGFESTSFTGDSKVYFNYYRQSDIEDLFKSYGIQIANFKRQEYKENDGTSLIDMIFIGVKN